LLQLGFVLALGFLVTELADVHDLAHRRRRRRGNFHQIQRRFLGQDQCLTNRNNP
jgi:hypothetical protein